MKRPGKSIRRRARSKVAAELLRLGIFAVVAIVIGDFAITYLHQHPQDVPWIRLRLDQPIGLFTGRKVAALGREPKLCFSVLDYAGTAYRTLPVSHEDHCGLSGGVILTPNGGVMSLVPADPPLSCAVATGLLIWQRQVVQPAAERILGTAVVRIQHYGTLNCRRMYGRSSGPWSEHATGNAIDVAGFDFEDGSTVRVRRDWHDPGPRGQFLHAVRDGACRLFATTLSPDYNEAHRDHLHIDEAARGEFGWRACR